MPKFRNISGQPLDIPVAGRVVDDDEVFEVSDDWFDSFACQPTNYAVVDEPRQTKKEA